MGSEKNCINTSECTHNHKSGTYLTFIYCFMSFCVLADAKWTIYIDTKAILHCMVPWAWNLLCLHLQNHGVCGELGPGAAASCYMLKKRGEMVAKPSRSEVFWCIYLIIICKVLFYNNVCFLNIRLNQTTNITLKSAINSVCNLKYIGRERERKVTA